VATVQHNGVVPKRRSPLEVVRTDGPEQLAFLIDAGLTGPHRTDDGIAYRNESIEIVMFYFGRPEPEVVTAVRCVAPDGAWQGAGLSCLHVACGYGVLQDVPGNAPNLRVVGMRVAQQATVLRRMLPRLLGEDVVVLVRRCQSRGLPLPQ
jgi:hypothetical protein